MNWWFHSSQNNIPKYIGFFKLKRYINDHNSDIILINTFPLNEQECVIKRTLTAEREIIQIQYFQDNLLLNKCIIIYGKNSIDLTVDAKYQQLINLGFTNIFIYKGGMFEWALLQDIYGGDEFPTTMPIRDPLKWSDNGGVDVDDSANKTEGWGNLLTYLS